MTRTRRVDERRLRVQIQFEQSRLSALWLVEAYERLLPVRGYPTTTSSHQESSQRLAGTSHDRRDA